MTIKSRKDELAKIFEHFCNDDAQPAGELLHNFIVERARDIHGEMIAKEEELREFALDGDMEHDLATDISDIHGGEEHHEGEGDDDIHGAEEELTSDMLDGTGEGEEHHEGGEEHAEGDEGGMEHELEAHEDKDEGVEERVENLEDEFEHLKAVFAGLADSEEEKGEEVTEATELTPVKMSKKEGEVGDGPSTGMATGKDAKSPLNTVKGGADTKVGGEPVEIGKGPNHKGYERETPPSHKDLISGATNQVKSSKDVLKPAGKQSGKYNVNSVGEVGSGKSGMPVEGNTKSVLGSKA